MPATFWPQRAQSVQVAAVAYRSMRSLLSHDKNIPILKIRASDLTEFIWSLKMVVRPLLLSFLGSWTHVFFPLGTEFYMKFCNSVFIHVLKGGTPIIAGCCL